jgi:dihydrofolate synthase/folylpolyglutamate synthase
MSRAEEILAGRQPIGWKLGLERMRRLCSLLGLPQNRFSSVHVVGTNGKTSVARMTAAMLEAHGVRSGAYLSPHILSWRERVLIGGEPISEEPFVGGRLDATNVLPSKVTVLTSVGLDHTEWLGETLEEIAAEKLAVLREHTTLITGALPATVEPLADREARRRHATRQGVAVGAFADPIAGEARDGAGAQHYHYQDANFGLAWAALSAVLGRPEAPGLSRRTLAVPGRAEVVEGDPEVIYDAAHNPDGAEALARTLPELVGEAPVVCCLAILTEKDAGAIVRALAPACESFVCTEIPEAAIRGSGRPAGSSYPAVELAGICRLAGAEAEAITDPRDAWERTREIARGRDGVALAAGSHYLLSCIWTERHAASS